jgi:hypothetical protein
MRNGSIAITSLLIALTAIIPLILHILISYQYLLLSLDTSNWIEITKGVIFLESIWAGALLFLSDSVKRQNVRRELNF